MDNTEAEFEVGASVPIINTNTTNGTVQTTTGKQEAKLSLKITPQINKVSRYVTLKINQSINDFIGDPSSATNGTGLATTIRSANTEIMAKDGDTIAMGGLLRDKEVTTFNKVPLLGDIPVLGWLFKSKNRVVEKVNLLFFLTPRIISPYEEVASKNSKRVLDNRLKNLKDVIDDENPEPFKEQAAELRAKIEAQQLDRGKDTNIYKQNNMSNEGIGPEANADDIPDYQAIADEAKK